MRNRPPQGSSKSPHVGIVPATRIDQRASQEQEDPVTHVRRCHVCGFVNSAQESVIHKCSHCGKHLAPFYYFDESKLEGLSEGSPFLSDFKNARGYLPIWGLSTYWF